jgi:inner membrane transporter RhtA
MEVDDPQGFTGRMPPALLVLGSVLSVQAGQAFGKHLLGETGPAGVIALRLGLAALVLLAVHRPALPKRRDLLPLLGFGTAIAGMNLIYPALRYLPMGVASALQLLGPLTVALCSARRIRHVAFAVLAGAGVWLLHTWGATTVSLPGIALALASGAAMGAYLLLSRKVGTTAADGSRLALAVTWAALLTLPFGVAQAGPELVQLSLLVKGFALALLSAVMPYSLDLAALRRVSPRTVGVLESTEAAVAGLAGAIFLAERLSFTAWAGIGCVTVAAIGAGDPHNGTASKIDHGPSPE